MSLGSLVVDLSANTAQFRSDLGKAAQMSQKFSSDMGRNMDVVKNSILGLGASAAGLGVVLTKMAINRADEINDLSKAAGVSTEVFSGLAFAAKQSGVEMEGLSTGLKKLNMNMVEAASGNKTMQATFDSMGINIRNADGSLKDAGATLSEIATKFATYKDGAEKSALAVQIFGKAGADLIPLLNEGGEGIKSMTERAAELGIVISSQTAKAADEFNDKLGELGTASSALGLQLAEDLLPYINSVTQAFIEAAKQGSLWEGVLAGASELGRAFDETPADKMGKKLMELNEQLADFKEGKDGLWFDADKENAQKKIEALIPQIAKLEKELVAARKAEEGLFNNPEKTEKQAELIAAPIVKVAEKVKEARVKVEKEVKMMFEDYVDQSQDAFEATQNLGNMFETTTSEITEMGKAAAQNIQDAFADFLFDPFKGGTDEMLSNFGDMIRKMIAQAAAAQLGKYLFGDLANGGDLGGLAGNLLGMMGGGSSTPQFDIGTPNFALAGGGAAMAGNTYLVGERGPEILQMGNVGGTVIPNKSLGGTTNLVVNVTGMQNAGEVRQAASAGARAAMRGLSGAQRYV